MYLTKENHKPLVETTLWAVHSERLHRPSKAFNFNYKYFYSLAVNVILDPDTANKYIFRADGKQVRHVDTTQKIHDPKCFHHSTCVLANEH